MRKYFSFINNLILIRRFTAFKLSRNLNDNVTFLKSMMFLHIVKTIKVKYNEDEKIKMQ